MQHRIVIVDDHQLIAEAIKFIIEKFPGYEVLYEAANGKKMIEQFSHPQNIPDIVLLDINMPQMNGFETATWLKQNYPGILILALSMQDDEKTLIKMMRSGARGYLLKNTHPGELKNALDSLVQKGFYYPDWIAQKVLQGLAASPAEEEEKAIHLSERELLFLTYTATELTYKEIAERMFCSPRTIEGYRDVLFEKLGLKTRIGLVMYAVRKGIIKV